MYLSLLGYCGWAEAIGLRLLIEIKIVSFAAGLFWIARGHSTPIYNSDKKFIFCCWAIVYDQGYSTPTYNSVQKYLFVLGYC